MKKSKLILSLILVCFIVLGIAFAVVYLQFYFSHNARYILYVIVSLFALAESLFVCLSLYLYLKEIKNTFAIIVYIISGILAIPILMITMLWILVLLGMPIIPPQQ